MNKIRGTLNSVNANTTGACDVDHDDEKPVECQFRSEENSVTVCWCMQSPPDRSSLYDRKKHNIPLHSGINPQQRYWQCNYTVVWSKKKKYVSGLYLHATHNQQGVSPRPKSHIVLRNKYLRQILCPRSRRKLRELQVSVLCYTQQDAFMQTLGYQRAGDLCMTYKEDGTWVLYVNTNEVQIARVVGKRWKLVCPSGDELLQVRDGT
ncbi:unnamed protein product [Orchesella dallaii]|uniref:Uncharacterized protein n=1 Tax=Orchesella dallaii TaxID=48710 RepID=A0ABP1S822_9HEXA